MRKTEETIFLLRPGLTVCIAVLKLCTLRLAFNSHRSFVSGVLGLEACAIIPGLSFFKLSGTCSSVVWLDWPANSRDPPVSTSLVPRLWLCDSTSGFYVDLGLNSGLYSYMTSTLLIVASSHLLILIFKRFCVCVCFCVWMLAHHKGCQILSSWSYWCL